MSRIIWDIPEETLLAMKVSPEKASAELRMAAAVKLYELGQLDKETRLA